MKVIGSIFITELMSTGNSSNTRLASIGESNIIKISFIGESKGTKGAGTSANQTDEINIIDTTNP